MKLTKIASYVNAVAPLPVIKDFFVYSFGSILLKSSHFLLMPLILVKLTTDDFGLLSLANNFINISAILIGLGLRQVVSLEFFHVDVQGQKKLLNEVIILYLTFSIPLLALIFLNLSKLNQFLFVGRASAGILTIALLTCFITFFIELFFQVMRYTSQAIRLTKTQLAGAGVTLILKFSFLYFFSYAVGGILLANFLGLLVIFFYALRLYFQKVPFLSCDILRNKNKVLSYLKRGLPFVPSVIFSWILASSDRWVLAHYTQLHDVGIYSYADAFSQLYQLFILYPLIGAYFPYIIKKFIAHKNDIARTEQENKKIMWLSMLVISFLIVVGYQIGKPLLMFLSPTKYHASLAFVVPLLLGQVILMGTHFITCYIQYLKKIHFIVGLISIPAIVNIALNIILVPQFQIAGCVAATVIAYVIYFGMTLWSNHYLLRRHTHDQSTPA